MYLNIPETTHAFTFWYCVNWYIAFPFSWWRHQMEIFSRYWSFVRRIHRSPVNSPHKGQWRGALMFTLICTRINGWVNNRVWWFKTPSRPLWRHRNVIPCLLIPWSLTYPVHNRLVHLEHWDGMIEKKYSRDAECIRHMQISPRKCIAESIEAGFCSRVFF